MEAPAKLFYHLPIDNIPLLCNEENKHNDISMISKELVRPKVIVENVVAFCVYVHASMPSFIMNAVLMLRLYITCDTHI